jgi:hypothetical protein
VSDQPPSGPFHVRGFPTDQSQPYDEESFARFGPALERAQNMASAMKYRTTLVIDLNSTVYAQFNMLWIIPRELR